MNVLSERWDFLPPWCAPVRGKLRIHHRSRMCVPTSLCAGIEVEFPRLRHGETARFKIQAFRDALLLISMVARVDRCGWEYLLVNHCELKTDGKEEYTESDEFAQPQFRLRFKEGEFPPHMALSVLGTFFWRSDSPPPSAHFSMAVRKIASYSVFGLARPIQVSIPVVVVMNGSCKGRSPFVDESYRRLALLKSKDYGWRFPFCTTASTQHDGRSIRETPLFHCSFVLERVEFELLTGNLLLRAGKVFTKMASREDDIPVSCVAMTPHIDTGLDLDDAESAQVLGRSVERLLCASGVPTEKRARLDQVFLKCLLRDPAAIWRLSSAIAEARTATSLRLRFKD